MNFRRMAIEKESPEEMGYSNLAYNLTESSAPDMNFKEIPLNLHDLVLGYTDHSGKPELRDLIASEYQNVPSKNILVTAGACLGLFIVNATLLNPGDHILVLKPNYATNIEVPRSLGITTDLLELKFENQFGLNLNDIINKFTPNTKLISITYPHNPTGMVINEKLLQQILDFAEQKQCYILVDETYREMAHGTKPLPAASLSKWAISVESFSKAYGLPGIRIGWIATQDSMLKDRLLATKEQVCICNSVIDEEIALQVLNQKKTILPPILAQNMRRFQILQKWMHKQSDLEWIEPHGGVVCFPRFSAPQNIDIPKFYQILNAKYGTFVGPGHWFEFDDRYFRIGYGWPTEDQLKQGLENISLAIQEARKTD